MKTKSFLYYILIFCVVFMLPGCSKNIFEPKNENFNVKAFISNVKSYDVKADYSESSIPIDTASADKPYISVQSWVIKGKDILISVTVPGDAEELYFGAVNPQADYMGLNFSGQSQNSSAGFYSLKLTNIPNVKSSSDGYQNYQVVLSSNVNIQLDKFDLIASYKSAKGISNMTTVPLDVIGIAPYQKNLRVGFRPLQGYTYSIKIGTPNGSQIIYTYDNSTGNEVFDNKQSPASALSYDSDLDFKWIEFSDPQFGGYTMSATIQIDFSNGSQTIYLLMAIVSEGKIDQLDLDADIQQTGENTAVGSVNFNFSYFQEYLFTVLMDKVTRDGYARIPKNISQTIFVKVSPDPLPNNEYISLELVTDTGTSGEAVFVKGDGSESATIPINSSEFITIKGKQNSSVKNNILLRAAYNGKTINDQRFSVRTWPCKFTQVYFPFSSPDQRGGVLGVNCNWESESRNIQDLSGIVIGEWVDYPGESHSFNWSSLTYRQSPLGPIDDPYIKNFIIGKVNDEDGKIYWDGFGDTHSIPTFKSTDPPPFDIAFKKPYVSDVAICTQYYRFNDPLIMEDNKFINISGPHYIRRNVYEEPANSNKWYYRIEKDIISAVRELP
jgi:hypothetical protein